MNHSLSLRSYDRPQIRKLLLHTTSTQRLGRTGGVVLLGPVSWWAAHSPSAASGSRGTCVHGSFPPSCVTQSPESRPDPHRQIWRCGSLALSPEDARVGFWVNTSALQTQNLPWGGVSSSCYRKGERSVIIRDSGWVCTSHFLIQSCWW